MTSYDNIRMCIVIRYICNNVTILIQQTFMRTFSKSEGEHVLNVYLSEPFNMQYNDWK